MCNQDYAISRIVEIPFTSALLLPAIGAQAALLAKLEVDADDFNSEAFKLLPEPDQKRIVKYFRSWRPAISTFFGGTLGSSVICDQCRTVTHRVEEYMDLSIPIRSGSATASSGNNRASDPTGRPDKKELKEKKRQRKQEEAARKKALKEERRRLKAEKRKSKIGRRFTSESVVGTEVKGSAAPSSEVDVEDAAGPAVGGVGISGGPVAGPDIIGEDSDTGSAYGFGDVGSSGAETPSDGGGHGAIDLDDLGAALGAVVLGQSEGAPSAPLADPPVPAPAVASVSSQGAPEYGPRCPPPAIRPGECSVYSCLAAFCTEERLDGSEMYACEACYKNEHPEEFEPQPADEVAGLGAMADLDRQSPTGVSVGSRGSQGSTSSSGQAIKRPAMKQMLIKDPGDILTLHLKRFEARTLYRVDKVSKHVSFPVTLDITPFCCKPPTDPDEGKARAIAADTGGGIGDQSRLQYTLYGVVVHHGRIHFGHYTAYVKTENSW